jgi:hypothetical protein
LELLSQPQVLRQPGSSMFCCICDQVFVPTNMIMALAVCSHKFHQPSSSHRFADPQHLHAVPSVMLPLPFPALTRPILHTAQISMTLTHRSRQSQLRLERRWQRLLGALVGGRDLQSTDLQALGVAPATMPLQW